MKTIISIAIFSMFFCSCAQYKYRNISNCQINIDVINKILKDQKVNAKQMGIVQNNNLSNSNEFSIDIIKWKGVKTDFVNISIPMFVIGNNIYINAFYFNGALREGFTQSYVDTYINDAILKFDSEVKQKYDTESLKKAEQLFRFGINVFPKGRLFLNF